MDGTKELENYSSHYRKFSKLISTSMKEQFQGVNNIKERESNITLKTEKVLSIISEEA